MINQVVYMQKKWEASDFNLNLHSLKFIRFIYRNIYFNY